jgi:hypothetical protein
MKAKVLKRMKVEGNIIEPGTILDVSTWRTRVSLSNNRYIELLPEEVVKPKQEKVASK